MTLTCRKGIKDPIPRGGVDAVARKRLELLETFFNVAKFLYQDITTSALRFKFLYVILFSMAHPILKNKANDEVAEEEKACATTREPSSNTGRTRQCH